MTTVEYECPRCGSRTETEVRADRLDACRNEGCPGIPKRVWGSVTFNRVPGGGREHRS